MRSGLGALRHRDDIRAVGQGLGVLAEQAELQHLNFEEVCSVCKIIDVQLPEASSARIYH